MPLDLVSVDLLKGAQRAPDYLALNPSGRTPTLVDGDFTLAESTAIMQYIAAKTPNTLWPSDARARADISRWQCFGLAHLGQRVLRTETAVVAALAIVRAQLGWLK